MSIEHEQNTKRLHHRVNVPLHIVVGERAYRACDWSLGGFGISGFVGEGGAGDQLDGSVVLPFTGFKVDFPVRFEIVRRDGDEVGCRFVVLDNAPRKAMRLLMEASIEGRLAEAGEVLSSIQEPGVSLESESLLEEDTDVDLALAGQHRIFRHGFAYLAASLLALASVGMVTWRSQAFVDIPDGIIMGSFVKVSASVAGRLVGVHVAEGEMVEAGTLLFSLKSQPLEGAVARAEANLASAEATVTALAHRVTEEKSRLELFVKVTREQVGSADAVLRGIDEKVELARLEWTRLETLCGEGIRSRQDADIAKQRHQTLLQQREEARRQRSIVALNQQATEEGRFFGGREIEGLSSDRREDLRIARAERDQAARELEVALDALGETRVTALEDGLVYSIYRQPGEVLRPNDAVVSLRSSGNHWAVGRLSAEEAIRIRPGMDVDLLIPTLSVRVRGRVTAIGHQAVSSATQVSADLESAMDEVPIKIALPRLPEGVPPGIRAEIRVYTPPNWTLSGPREQDSEPLPAPDDTAYGA